MSVDTRDKRMSMLGLALAVRLVLPNPDGGFTTAGDRAQLTGQYAGTLTAPTSIILSDTWLVPDDGQTVLVPDDGATTLTCDNGATSLIPD